MNNQTIEPKLSELRSRAVITYLNGRFWLRHNNQSQAVPVEHCSSRQRIEEWAEAQNLAEVFYNFDDDVLPDTEPVSSATPAYVTRPIPIPRLQQYRPPSLTMAQHVALRREKGILPGGRPAERVQLQCSFCHKPFTRAPSEVNQVNNYCSPSCSSRHQVGRSGKSAELVEVQCHHCQSPILRKVYQLKGARRWFCAVGCKNQYYREHPHHTSQPKPSTGE